MAGQIYNVPY